MWVDETGRGHSLAMNNPGELLSPTLRRRLKRQTRTQREQLLDELTEYTDAFFNELIHYVRPDDEDKYVEIAPPSDLVVHVEETSQPLGKALVAEIESTPFRWRGDLLFAATQYVGTLNLSRWRKLTGR
jgi:hypothetical protein